MEADKSRLLRRIMHNVEEIYKMTGPAVPEEWLSSDITVTQLRLLLVLQSLGAQRMSDLASHLKVTLPTATIEVNSLVRKKLLQRESNPQDRREVIITLSPEGQALTDKLLGSGQMAIRRLLEGLTLEQMQKAAEIAELLRQKAAHIASKKKIEDQ